MKIKGAELSAFLSDESSWWPQPPGDWFMELDKGMIDQQMIYETSEIGGFVFYMGREEDPTDGEGYDISKFIRRWRKSRSHTFFAASIPNDRVEEFKAFVKSIGGTI